jgi:hypothetical protein
LGQFVSLFETPLGGQHQPIGYIVVQGTVHLTEGYAALRAARGLLGGAAGIELAVDLIEILAPGRRVPLVGHALVDADELQHSAWHTEVSPLAEFAARQGFRASRGSGVDCGRERQAPCANAVLLRQNGCRARGFRHLVNIIDLYFRRNGQ